MAKVSFKNLIQKGELAREKGNYKTALVCFDEAMLTAGQENRWADFVETIGHKVVIDKHFWQTTKDRGFLELMRTDIELGLRMCEIKKLPKRYLAVFQLRMGDILVIEKRFKDSVLWFRRAVKSLTGTPKNSGYSEYLRHLGAGLALAGQKGQAEKTLLESLKLLKRDKKVRRFQSLNLEISVISWLSFAIKNKNPEKSNELVVRAGFLAKELKDKYKMPMRLKQLAIMKKELKL